MHGWAIALVLIALVVPFAVASVDLFARCRRRHVPLGPAFRAYRRRLGFWLWIGVLFWLFTLFGAFPDGAAVPPDPSSSAAGDWPRLALLLFVVLVAASWLVARRRLAPTRPVTAEEELAGQTAALLVLGLISLLVIATNVYALLLLLPSMHAWLWLPQVRNRSAVARGLVFAAGLIGPALFLGLFAKRFGVGLDTPWYLAELTAIGYVPIVAVVLALAWAAAAAQPSSEPRDATPLSGRRRGRSARCRALRRPHGRARSPWPQAAADDAQGVRGMRQAVRITGAVLVGAGVLGIAWALLVWQWQDPVTALYTTYQQHRLSVSYERAFASYRLPFAPVTPASPRKHTVDLRAEERLVSKEARSYRLTLERGEALGRLKVPRLGLSIIVVTGTDESSLEKGPGWYTGSKLPGEGQLIYIAGHRTTFLAPFAHIDELQRGDAVTLELPYGTFLYRITGHVVVPADDLARLKSRGFETVALQACHPRFFATHRYIAYARPVRVIPRRGVPYLVSRTGRLTPERSY